MSNIPSPIIQAGTSFDKTVERNRVAEVSRAMNGLSDAGSITISTDSAFEPNLVHSTSGPVSKTTVFEKNLNADPLNAVEYLGRMDGGSMQLEMSNFKLKIAGDARHIDMLEEQLTEAFEGKPGIVTRAKSAIKGLNDYLVIHDDQALLALAQNGLDALSALKQSASSAAQNQGQTTRLRGMEV